MSLRRVLAVISPDVVGVLGYYWVCGRLIWRVRIS